jgi:hypothetical protein
MIKYKNTIERIEKDMIDNRTYMTVYENLDLTGMLKLCGIDIPENVISVKVTGRKALWMHTDDLIYKAIVTTPGEGQEDSKEAVKELAAVL